MKKGAGIKNSIRTQFAVIFILVMIVTLGAYWIINTLFLQKYYIKDRKNRLMDAYDLIDDLVSEGDIESVESGQSFYKLCSASNLSAAIVNSGLETLISTTGDDNILTGRLFDHVFDADDTFLLPGHTGSGNEIKENKPKEKPKNIYKPVVLYKDSRYEICTSADPRIGIEYLELWGTVSTGDYIIMRTALNSIRESAGVSNRFLAQVGFLMIILCAAIIWLVTGKITKPIEELAELSERMSSLDFDAKYKSGGNNEIGILGEHMNELSETLEKTISELKTSNNELKRDIEIKEKQDSMRVEFLSNVSHELKTPIALISGYAEGLKDNVADDEESREYYCDVIIDEADRMGKLVKNLMTLNELEFGENIKVERFDVAALVSGCLQASELLIKQNGITVSFEEKEPRYVWSDEFMTEEVFNNYLSNAVHYCEPGKAGEKRIDIGFEDRGDTLRISVSNTGTPIPEEALPRLFDKFYKVDKARTREYGGSGVGLSIVKAVMDSLNRDYGVTNLEDGVCFWFELDKRSE